MLWWGVWTVALCCGVVCEVVKFHWLYFKENFIETY